MGNGRPGIAGNSYATFWKGRPSELTKLEHLPVVPIDCFKQSVSIETLFIYNQPFDPTQPLLPLVQPAYGLVDAWISWLSGNAKWRFGVSGKNLTDEEYLTNGYNLPVLGSITGSYGAPRTFVATLEFRFF